MATAHNRPTIKPNEAISQRSPRLSQVFPEHQIFHEGSGRHTLAAKNSATAREILALKRDIEALKESMKPARERRSMDAASDLNNGLPRG